MDNVPIVLQQLSWDSQFLGFPVARLEIISPSAVAIDDLLAKAREAHYKLLYIVVEPDDDLTAIAARRAGAWLADRKVTFVMDLSLQRLLARPRSVIDSATKYTSQLESLAWQSGEYSRFRLDPRFAPHVFKDLYSQWLRNSLIGEIAKRVLVFRNEAGIEQGILTLGEKNTRADIGLLAVDEALRGKGVAQDLVAAAIEQAYQWGYRDLQVVTQGNNEPACRFYRKCGFQLAQEQHIYHLWLD